MERERETAPVQSPVSATVYNLETKNLHFYLNKKVVKRSLERYRVRQVNPVRLTVSIGSPGPKIRVVHTNLYLLPK